MSYYSLLHFAVFNIVIRITSNISSSVTLYLIFYYKINTWNVRGIYRAGAIRSVTGEVQKYIMDPVEVQEV